MLDSEATKGNIVNHLQSVVDGLRYRDKFVFTFSGHGTWIPDQSGDEIDGRDEALCCYDFPSGGLLNDDELHLIFGRAKHGTQITILSDSCHSGTVARGLVRDLPPGIPKFISPGVLPTVLVTVEQAIAAESKYVKAVSRTGPVLISGCDDAEYSYDANFGGKPNGAFTRVAIDTLTPDVKTMREWHRKIRAALPSSTYPQSPQLGASRFQQFRKPLA